MCIACSQPTNHVIAGLPEDVRQRWLPQLEKVNLPQRLVLHESGHPMNFAYFPTTAIVSIVYVTADGESTELAVIGNEGIVGIELLLGGGSTPNRAVVGGPGEALRLPARVLQEEVIRFGSASQLLLRYTLALSSLVAQTAVCNRHHSLYERLCRWLLLNLDRGQDNVVVATHEQIAYSLGVRREGVTEGALRLQTLGQISYARGRIQVVDRTGLERQACECYRVVKNEYTRLLPLARSTPQPLTNPLDLLIGQPF
ncbi:Crp/Fnr family transcriptional regulator [Hydrogenophaga sp.]|uniref:Crp/Fnr family transcriptional regulator n=1 Tax=Hydrogenophaga sp. TaxID=1904254 RepID=UPI002FC99C88